MKSQPHVQGLTLIEVLVAIAIFSIAIVGVLAVLPSLFKMNSKTNTSLDSSVYARTVVEKTRSLWLTKVTPPAGTTDNYPYFTSGSLPADLPVPPGTLTCAPLQTATVPVATTTITTPAPVVRRRLTISCTPRGSTAPDVYVVEIARPG